MVQPAPGVSRHLDGAGILTSRKDVGWNDTWMEHDGTTGVLFLFARIEISWSVFSWQRAEGSEYCWRPVLHLCNPQGVVSRWRPTDGLILSVFPSVFPTVLDVVSTKNNFKPYYLKIKHVRSLLFCFNTSMTHLSIYLATQYLFLQLSI